MKDTPESFAVAKEGEKVTQDKSINHSINPKPLTRTQIVIKHTFDGFMNTELEAYLKEKGKKIVLTCGLITSCCVLFTTAGAFMRGFLTCVVEDCCGDRTKVRYCPFP